MKISNTNNPYSVTNKQSRSKEKVFVSTLMGGMIGGASGSLTADWKYSPQLSRSAVSCIKLNYAAVGVLVGGAIGWITGKIASKFE